ncbi:Isochorismatase hydrolase [Polychaeton citri CBS 116435]|uniref:Isochorismatase hydrolase n=1 Tax=Polychaeton citri CBS 116435 TaxID=1314669 RepID=A0A9P4UK63_9PEZI|nr:Isochorismatase hydrolase [Polychaeton citri CBS 116435]
MTAATIRSRRTGLLLIDIQEGFRDPKHWGTSRSTPNFEANVAALLATFRASRRPIFHVCHHSHFPSSPLHPDKVTSGFMSCAAPEQGEGIFPKTTNSPFIGTSLASEIAVSGISRLVICGLMTTHCVSTAVRMASNLQVVPHLYGTPFAEDKTGYEDALVLVDDATATFNVQWGGKDFDAETVHAVHLSSLNDEFCKVASTQWVIQYLLPNEVETTNRV